MIEPMKIMNKLLLSVWLLLSCQMLQAQKIVFTPQWMAQAQFSGYYMADSLGYYKSEGLDVDIVHPTAFQNALHRLKSGEAQFITMTLSQALYASLHGVDLVNVMQTSQVNSLMLVSHTPIENLSSLQNRSIAIWNYIDTKILDNIASKFGVKANFIIFNSGGHILPLVKWIFF